MCARYRDMSFKEFLKMGVTEFSYKLASIPENEPLYTIIKSRSINLSTIKNKDERKYWRNLKRVNEIPQIYLSTEEIYSTLKSEVNKRRKI